MTALLPSLEAASGPSIALDAEICWTLERDRATAAFWRGAIGLPRPLPDEFSRLPRGLGMASLEVGSPNYTASVDAALALAERVLPGMLWCVAKDDGHYRAWVASREDVVANPLRSFSARTPALALCAAIIRARSAGEGGG